VRWASTQVSTAIVQKQALQEARSLVEDRTARLQQNLDVQATLYEKTRQQIHQLQELNQLKDEFTSSMSHELRTPLTSMSLAIRMLRQPELAPERREKYLEILEQQCNREIDLIDDLLSLQRLESDRASIQPQPIDLVPLIQKLARSFAEKWGDKPLTLDVDCESPSLVLSTGPESLHRILLELLANAGKYSHPNTTVRLKVAKQTHISTERVVFTLTNIGSGIAPDDLNHIFEKFRRGQGVTQQAVPGTGLGLALVKCLVQQLNGTIEVSTYPAIEERATAIAFKLALPQLPLRSS
jgi:signal transduction histidine kinase